MPWKERILSEEDRTFATGPGNWVGDFAWSPDVVWDRQGYIYCNLDWEKPPKVFSLSYPFVRMVKEEYNFLRFWIAPVPPTGGYITIDYYLTDGSYSLGVFNQSIGRFALWWPFYTPNLLPSDWNLPNSSITINIRAYPGSVLVAAFRDFSLVSYLPEKKDHLPLVGVH